MALGLSAPATGLPILITRASKILAAALFFLTCVMMSVAARAQAVVQLGSGFALPAAVAVDSQGNVFVADASRNAIEEIPTSGGPQVQIGAAEGNFNEPQGLAVDAAGNVFVADTDNGAIKEIMAAGGYVTVNTLVPNGTLSNPLGIAVDSDENVFVANVVSPAAVYEVLAADNYATIVSLGSGFHSPVGVALDSAADVYVSDPADPSNVIKEIVAAGGYQTVKGLTTGGVAVGQLAIDTEGNLYTGLPAFGTVIKITPSGGTPRQGGSFNFGDVFGIAVDASGNIYVANENSSSIDEIEAATTTMLGVAPSSSTLGAAVTLTATVTGSAGSPTGEVTFFDSGVSFGLGTVASGVASLTTQTLAVGTHSFTASYSGDLTFAPSTSAAQPLTVNPAATTTTLTSSANPSLPGQSVTFTAFVSATGGAVTFQVDSNSPVTFDLVDGQASFSSATLVTGSHSITATYDGTTDFASSTSSILQSVAPLPLTATPSAVTQVGQAYVQTNVASGGIGPITYTASGTLPSGTLLNAASGTVSGIPTTAGAFSYTVTATDSVGDAATATLSGTIEPPTLTLAATPSATKQVGQAYSQTNVANGGTTPYTYSVSAGVLPPGTSLSPSSGLVSGTPTAAGAFSYTIKVTDSSNPRETATQTLSGTIAPPNLTLAATPSATKQVGQAYSQTNVASGGTTPYTYSVSAGILPAGTSLSPSSGLVSGTPTAAGAFSYTIKVTDSSSLQETRTRALSGTITPSPAPTVTAIAPRSGPVAGATVVTLTGTNLTGASAVSFGAAAAASFTVNSATSISAVSPAGALGTVDVTVTTPGDTSAITSGDRFTYAPALGQMVQQGPPLIGSGAAGAAGQGHAVALSADGGTAAVGGFDDNAGAGAVWVYTASTGSWTQQGGKLVGSGAAGAAHQGWSVALSSDGSTMVVGGNADNANTGAAWVFVASNGVWTQQGGKLTASDEVGAGMFGASVALSSDGNTAIIGGSGDNGGAGAAWIFTRSAGVWTQEGAKLVGSGASGDAGQGTSVALSGAAGIAAVGGSSDATNAGAVWVYAQNAGTWTPAGSKLVGSGATGAARQGGSLALSGDGLTLMVGGSADGGGIGAVWVFSQGTAAWVQEGGKLVARDESGVGLFGAAVAVSGDGSAALIGGSADNANAGAMWVFTGNGGLWTQQGAKLVGNGVVGAAEQGFSVSLSAAADIAITGGPADNASAGAVWIFEGPSALLAAILPESRSVEIGNAATIFATIINTGASLAPACFIAPTGNTSGAFTYQTTNPTSNQPIGTANMPVDIPGNNAGQSFVIALSPSAALAPTNLAFSFACANVARAPAVVGLNTLLLSASTTPAPDVIALVATLSNDGILHITGANGTAAFAVATDNVGAGASIIATANTGSASLPLALALCPTNPQTGQCLVAPATSVTTTMAATTTATFAIFATAAGAIPLDPANSRIFVQFADQSGLIRGSTSVAVETQ